MRTVENGSNTVPSLNFGTNSGGSGYPAAGIGGRWRWPVEGGNWATGACGYVGTWGDEGDNQHGNGNNGFSLSRTNKNNHAGDDGGSYFSYGERKADFNGFAENITKLEIPCERWRRRCRVSCK